MDNSGSYLQEPQVLYLSRLLDDVRNGNVLIPRFQREFVWDDDQRLRLMDSLREGLPIGSILVWRTVTPGLKTFPRIGGIAVPTSETRQGPQDYVLDGHQRLSTLFSALSLPPPAPTASIKDDWELTAGDIYFDLANECFVIGNKPDSPALMPLHLAFNSKALLQFGRDMARQPDHDPEWIERADALAERFRNTKLPIIPIVTNDLNVAVRAFQRVNSSGKEMSDVHMIRALTFSADYDLATKLEEAQEQLADVGWRALDEKYLIGVVRTRQELAVTSPDAEVTAPLLAKSPHLLDEATAAAKVAAQWLLKHCDIPGPSLIPYSYQFVLLAAAFAELGPPKKPQNKEVAMWLWRTTLSGHFQGMRDNQLRAAYHSLKQVIAGKEKGADFTLRLQVSQLQDRYSFRTARVKMLALEMLRHRLANLKPKERDAALDYVRSAGPDCMGRIVRESGSQAYSSLANRFVMIAADEQRRFSCPLIKDELHPAEIVTDAELGCLEDKDYERFVTLRMARLRDLELEFLRRSVLTPQEVKLGRWRL